MQSSVFTQSGFWIATGILYGLMFRYISYNTIRQLRELNGQVSILNPDMPEYLVGPLRDKRNMYIRFLLLLLLMMFMEVRSNVGLALRVPAHTNSPVYVS